MAEVLVVRHAQASFGQEDYDRLSDTGHRQSELLGAYLSRLAWRPDRIVIGTLRRHAQTLASMGVAGDAEVHAGFNEYDFQDLLACRFNGNVPEAVRADRKAHFRTLRETILAWQADGIPGVRETWHAFTARVAAARETAMRPGAENVLVITSGGPIGRLVAQALSAPDPQMMALNLQVKNTSMTRFRTGGGKWFLNEFNTTPHLDAPENVAQRTYS